MITLYPTFRETGIPIKAGLVMTKYLLIEKENINNSAPIRWFLTYGNLFQGFIGNKSFVSPSGCILRLCSFSKPTQPRVVFFSARKPSAESNS